MSILLDILANGVVDDAGEALDGGQVFVYEVGTTNRVDIFSDKDLTVPMNNPLTLDAAGKAQVYVEDAVRLYIEDADGNVIDDLEEVGSESGQPTQITEIFSEQLPPLGSIIPFYDFDGQLAFNTDYWAYCNGQSVVISGATRQTPDMSNRYLVGFGTEGGADNGSAAWATAAVGLASHQANLAHVHAVPGHGHDILDTASGLGVFEGVTLNGSPSIESGTQRVGEIGGPDGDNAFDTDSKLSSTESVQPRSIRVRYIMRIK